MNAIFPKLVREKPYQNVTDWPRVHLWANGVVIVEEKHHVIIWHDGLDAPRRYEWAALSDFPRPDQTLTGLIAIRYILDRFES